MLTYLVGWLFLVITFYCLSTKLKYNNYLTQMFDYEVVKEREAIEDFVQH